MRPPRRRRPIATAAATAAAATAAAATAAAATAAAAAAATAAATAAAAAAAGPSSALGARRRDVDTGPELHRRLWRGPLRGVTAHLGGRLPHRVLRRVVQEPPSQVVVVVPVVRFKKQASVVVRAISPLR